MPYRCCVPRCNGNYPEGPKVSVFSFPQADELRKKWILAIKRDDFQPTQSSRVCELHFLDHDIVRHAEAYDEKTGQLLKVPLKIYRLKEGAFPKILPHCPDYLSTSDCNHRESPDERRERIENEQLQRVINDSILSKQDYDRNNLITNLDHLDSKLISYTLPDNLSKVKKPNKILICELNLGDDNLPCLSKCISVNSDLSVSLFIGNTSISKIGNFKLPFTCNNFIEFSSFIETVNTLSVEGVETVDSMNSVSCVKVICIIDAIEQLLNRLKLEIPDKEHTISFLQEQICKLNYNKHAYEYTNNLLIFSSLFFSISPHAYRYVRNTCNLILPHPNTIKRLCSKIGTNPSKEHSEQTFLQYIKMKFKSLSTLDKTVILMMDEVHLKPAFDFKSGDIVGNAYDSEVVANSAHVFMIQSLLSSYKDVVYILPVQKITAEHLHVHLHKIIMGLKHIGFKIICISSDNNSINRKTMSLFCSPPSLQIVYSHPYNRSRPLFYVIDAVHLLKCIRNNWINQRTENQTLYYPSFTNNTKIVAATFSALKQLHAKEMNVVVKYGYGLSMKALYPNNLERQNVKLVLQVFNQHVIEGLRMCGSMQSLPNFNETADFLDLIYKWWNIMNVKSVFKGKHKLDPFMEPLTASFDDQKIMFLYQLMSWLDNWKSNVQVGKLTTETHTALTHTTYAVIELTKYCIQELNLSYILELKKNSLELNKHFFKKLLYE